MSDSPRMRNVGDRVCGKMTGGGVVSYPCVLAPHDEGPCVARELPATAIARARWESARDQSAQPDLGGEDARVEVLAIEQEVDRVTSDDIAAPEAPGETMDLSSVNADRDLQAMWDVLREKATVAELPQSIRVVLSEAVQRRVLSTLWDEASRLFQAGAERVTISSEDLATIVPTNSRG